MWSALLLLLFTNPAVGTSVQPRAIIDPTIKTATLYGVIAQYEPNYLDRDSCGTTAWGDRVLYVCRDTEIYVDRENTTKGTAAFFSSSASYINKNADGSLPFEPYNSSAYGDYGYEMGFKYRLPTYGNNHNMSFYPLQADEDPQDNGGNTTAGTRFVIWPDSPPLVSPQNTSSSSSTCGDGKIRAYTWIKKAEITDHLSVVIPYPATSLYRLDYDPAVQGHGDTLPEVTIVQEEFFKENEWNYGTYGSVSGNGYSYLYGQPLAAPNVSLARVPQGSEENVSDYEYFVGGQWTSTMPALNDSASWLPETFGAQGSFYYSEVWQCYVWIGQPQNNIAFDVLISTAPAPEGPWTGPKLIYTENDHLTGFHYTIQANPALLSSPTENAMWVSYTQAISGYGYNTILYKFDWE
ncbi:hypothetical protein BD324DRAFT_648255 [Kockovaella imperatae]|uniref:DUF4185 domain-containing protein n=1 Tax=Kockovaella imperatae TaxID=4999 RepID=A0A1Y1UQ84_9TREE|nr:hypothetical protein BD324DRAFT_648255 [Kockovaella imperatae]ORX39616.1 hypothetical protein BD324DRAFT_648255 [Kockovaella imperatae]